QARAADPVLSILTDPSPTAPVSHGLDKLFTALKSGGTSYEKVTSLDTAHGKLLLIATLSHNPQAAKLLKSEKLTVPQSKESLLIHHTTVNNKPVLLLTAPDDRGLMYALLDTADRIAWSADPSDPFAKVVNTIESP